MSRTALDTSVLVAAFQLWHADHQWSVEVLSKALEEPPVVVPIHVLIETYSVLTRLPRPVRLSPERALALIDRTLHGKSDVVGLQGEPAFGLLRGFQERGISGGAAYDALIAETAFRAGARSLLTLNRRHFERLAPDGLEIAGP